MNAFIRLLYSLLIAAAVLTFFGVSIYSVYQPPKEPDYSYSYDYNESENPEDYDRQNDEYEKQLKEYETKQNNYYQNVSYALLPLSVLVLAAGVWLIKRSEVLGEGLALGGLSTSIYAIVTSSIADARFLRLAAVTLFLAGTLLLAHRRFISSDTKKT